MRHRAFIQVNGSPGSGKTTFIEHVLKLGLVTTCIRCLGPRDSSRLDELERYARAGASCHESYRRGTRSDLDFWEIGALEEYSQVVLIEGPPPSGGLDFSVFVASPGPHRLLTRVKRDSAAAHRATVEQMREVFPELGQMLDLRLLSARHMADGGDLQWSLSPHYRGIENAQMVLVNLSSETQRPQAEELLRDVERLRKDPQVFEDVMGFRAKKLAITAAIANLADAKDGGLKKAVARVKRVCKNASQEMSI